MWPGQKSLFSPKSDAVLIGSKVFKHKRGKNLSIAAPSSRLTEIAPLATQSSR